MLKDSFSSRKKNPTVSQPAVPSPPPAPTRPSPAVDPQTISGAQKKLNGPLTMAELMYQRLAEAEALGYTGDSANEGNETSTTTRTINTAGDTGTEQDVPRDGFVINDLYRCDRVLAKGGMGQVLIGYHLKRDIPVVIKLMLQEVDREDPNFKKFLQECMLTARIRHPNVVNVIDYGILIDGLKPYLVMEFVEGESLRKIIREAKQLNEHDVARAMIQVCEGLSKVHSKGIIHRDLKPENIMIRAGCWMDDSVKILDFGIAQLQKESDLNKDRRVVGSLGYMSPERLCNGIVDTRTDIYSLGVIYYEALTGCAPFRGNTAVETMAMHVKAQHVPPSKIVRLENPQVDEIIARALAKNPDDRYQNAAEMRDDIKLMLGLLQ